MVFIRLEYIFKPKQIVRKKLYYLGQKKQIKLITKGLHESYENAKIRYICKEKFENKNLKDKKYRKVGDHCHYTGKYGGTAHD